MRTMLFYINIFLYKYISDVNLHLLHFNEFYLNLQRNHKLVMKLLFSALAKLIVGLAAIATLLFAPAGTFAYPGAWRLISLLFIPMLIIGIVF